MAEMIEQLGLSARRRRRGAVRASITKLVDRVRDLERKADLSASEVLAALRSVERLKELDDDFKQYHFAVVDLLEDEDEEKTEQAILDEHDERVAKLTDRLQTLTTRPKKRGEPTEEQKLLRKRLEYIESNIGDIKDVVGLIAPGPDMDRELVEEYREQIGTLKQELMDVSRRILALKEDDTGLARQESGISKLILQANVLIRRLLRDPAAAGPSSGRRDGIELPRIDIPAFNGDIMEWRSFWEQFEVSVHSKPHLSDPEKLAYLRQAVKSGPARYVIEGLSGSGDDYRGAIQTLRERYDRPRLLHQAHVRAIAEAPQLKDGNGRELRRLHDNLIQHLRALKAMDYEPSGPFVTSLIELKFDATTAFEWRRHTQDQLRVPHYNQLLKFLDLRAQASESTTREVTKRSPQVVPGKSQPRPVYLADLGNNCTVCGMDKHPLYICRKFKTLSYEQRLAVARERQSCLNCLKEGHFKSQCPSIQRCQRCNKPHHTLLHKPTSEGTSTGTPSESRRRSRTRSPQVNGPSSVPTQITHLAHPDSKSRQQCVLLMTCQLLVITANGQRTRARALLDSASSTSFITERLAQHLRLPRQRGHVQVAGIGGIHCPSSCSIVSFGVASSNQPKQPIWGVEAVVLPKITAELPTLPVALSPKWKHLSGIRLADPEFGVPGPIDILLGVDVFSRSVLHGRRSGPPGSPFALETRFGWVLSGVIHPERPQHQVVSCLSSVHMDNDFLRRFWEVESCNVQSPPLSMEEKAVVDHFHATYSRDKDGRFTVPLPKKEAMEPLGESRSSAVRRFCSLERSLHKRGKFEQFAQVVEEYFTQEHAELVPLKDLDKPCEEVFYLPMHAVTKESSTTTQLRVVFDASAKTRSGVSLNDQLLVGPTVHAPLLDVLLRFRCHRVALATDISRMYRAVSLPPDQRDLHRFVWRRNPNEALRDYRMTRLTFGVSASSFAANMAVKQNARLHEHLFPLAALVVLISFYVDDGLTGADSIPKAIGLQKELQELFGKGGFLLRKWRSNEPAALRHLPPDLVDQQSCQGLPVEDNFKKVLGIEWSTDSDSFRLTAGNFLSVPTLTKRALSSEIAKVYDILGLFSPSVIKVKLLLQRLWEAGIDWDDPVPQEIETSWKKWKDEICILQGHLIPRCYFTKQCHTVSMQLHGFSDASEVAYAGVVYLRSVDTRGNVHVSLVMAKTKVAPIKRLTMPRLELCGALITARLLHHVSQVLQVSATFAWTDSTVVLSWLKGNPRRFKTFVGNRISEIMELAPPEQWRHVPGSLNPADCASRGLYPSDLAQHHMWWDGPEWLSGPEADWPSAPPLDRSPVPSEEKEIASEAAVALLATPIELPLFVKISNYVHLKRVTAWMLRFIHNCRARVKSAQPGNGHLKTSELIAAEELWIASAQSTDFPEEITAIRSGKEIPKSKLSPFRPILDSHGLLRVGGRQDLSEQSFAKRHPLVLSAKNPLTRKIIEAEHLRLLHAGPTLVAASLARRFHIIGGRTAIRSITRSCIICRRVAAKPRPPLLGQLPTDRLDPGHVFDRVGVDYAGPIMVKSGSVRRPTLTKSYVCVFVSFTVKAVHLEPVSDLTTEAFLATLRRFIARRGKPSVIWSDHGTNFVGASRELRELFTFLDRPETRHSIFDHCTAQHIEWHFSPEQAPHFGGLWEAAVKSFKQHFRKVVGNVRLTFEELATTLAQIEACLNSRPLTPLPDADDGIEALTPGHFLIGRPLEALPDSPVEASSISLLRRWRLCQALVQHFWKRWSAEYLTQLQRFGKWTTPARNVQVGDVVCVRDEHLAPTKWPLARVVGVYPGQDGQVRVVTVRTSRGTYKRPVTKIVTLIHQ